MSIVKKIRSVFSFLFFYKLLKKIDLYLVKYVSANTLGATRNRLIQLSIFHLKGKRNISFNFDGLFNKRNEDDTTSILIVGNADTKKRAGELIDSFPGIVARMNRFQDVKAEYYGRKTNYWLLTEPLVFDERNYYRNNIRRIRKDHSELYKCYLMPRLKNEDDYFQFCRNVENYEGLEVYDTTSALNLYRNIVNQFISQGGKLIIKNQTFFNEYGYPNPSTGLLAILFFLKLGYKVYISNFDFFKTNHYWVDEMDKTQSASIFRGQNVDNIIGDHEFHFEEHLVDQLMENGFVNKL